MKNLEYGQAVIEPGEPLVAGSFTSLTFTYTAGHPIDETGFVKLVFRQMGDFGTPQFTQPEQPNYTRIETTGHCSIQPRWDAKGHTRPWSNALFLKVTKGYLDSGEKIIVRFGDVSQGSPGWQVQTFCEKSFEFKTFVDPIATCTFKELPHSPALPVVPGSPARAVCIAPSQAAPGESFSYYVKLEDRWGNPLETPRRFTHPGFAAPGIYTFPVTDEPTGLSAESNPLQVTEPVPGRKYFWADFHGQSEETIGTNTIEDYFRFAREDARLDIAAHQGNDFQVSDAFWDKIQQTAKDFDEPGWFVTFPGYEWSGNTSLGGDRNVYFLTEGGRISRSSRDLLAENSSTYPDSLTAADLFRVLKTTGQPPAFVFAHVGGRYADLDMHDLEIEIAVEVHSAWGTFDWLVEDALQRGYRIGICANSDGHKGRPGASYPGASTFGSYGGLTCVLAESLDREAVYSALKARHFYATTGNRSLVDLCVEIEGSHLAQMGDVVVVGAGAPVLRAQFYGTAGVEYVEVYNGLCKIAVLRSGTQAELSRRIKLLWEGAEIRGRGRMTAWDGSLEVKENQIAGYTPVNFWNPDHPVRQPGSRQLEWLSSTTGGAAGIDFTLQSPDAGELSVSTVQGNFSLPIRAIGLEPRTWDYGGIKKKVSLYRLPEFLPPTSSIELSLEDLHPGDNPIYLRIVQEDGHLAWTSPVTLIK
jgi:hypothetical protein